MGRLKGGAAVLLAAAVLGAAAAGAAPAQAPIKDRGDFKLVYNKRPAKPANKRLLRLLLGPAAFRDLVEGLNEVFALPRKITVSLAAGDGPYYDPSTRTIRINYDFVQYVEDLFRDAGYSKKQSELDDVAIAITYFVFFHEVGHAFVDQYDLPITGREEDAVDELATVIVTEYFDAAEIALAAALMFDLSSYGVTEFEEADFWDVHSLDRQRFYSILCWVYGSDPKEFRADVRELGLGQDRLEGCPYEYRQKVRAWERLLEPYVKE